MTRLGVSSAAAPDAQLPDLVESCVRRGIDAIELRECDAHGVAFDAPDVAVHAGMIAGIVPTDCGDAVRLARTSNELCAPVIVADDTPLRRRIGLARLIAGHGGRALPLMQGAASGWLDLITASAAPYAWQIDASCTSIAEDAAAVLERAGRPPEYIRFMGGGPESSLQSGLGVGELMGRLALAGFAGPLILLPSSIRFRIAWASWLGRRGGWGCGSRVADPTLVRIS